MIYICCVRKLIDIPDEIIKDLKKLAVDANLDLKNFIEKTLIDLTKPKKSKK